MHVLSFPIALIEFVELFEYLSQRLRKFTLSRPPLNGAKEDYPMKVAKNANR